MPESSTGGGKAANASVQVINGPVPDDHPSHKARVDAAKDHVERSKKQLEHAEAELARLLKEGKGL